MQSRSYRIGVDVGGTNTDAVLLSLSPDRVIASFKAPTTVDVTSGITEAIRAVMRAGGALAEDITCVIIGTTHFVNAVVQRSPVLRRVGVVRLCGGGNGFGVGVPPFVDFPRTLSEVLQGPTFYCNGGYQISGTEISPLNQHELLQAADQFITQQIFDIVVSGVYSPLDATHEEEAGKVILERMRRYCLESASAIHPHVTLSHSVSSIGFLARENAAILNASVRPYACQTIAGFQKAMREVFSSSSCPIYLTQNDGSILSFSDAVELPIRTFNSGPTNSIRGGEFLWNTTRGEQNEHSPVRKDDLVVIDIGGTTSDSGLLFPDGVPRMSSLTSYVGAVRTNFALPAVESIGLGGGSVVKVSADSVAVGPESVALDLRTKALLFGGNVLTATDIATVSRSNSNAHDSSLSKLDRPERLSSIPQGVVEKAKKEIHRLIEDLVDQTKIQTGDIDVLVVGGGAILIETDRQYAGVRAIKKVRGGEVANAVGAAISRVSGVVDTVVDMSHQSLKEAQEQTVKNATEIAIKNGAKGGTIEVAEVNILPIQYVDAKARVYVKVLGTLDSKLSFPNFKLSNMVLPESLERKNEKIPQHLTASFENAQATTLAEYVPMIKNREWIISVQDVEWIAAGCKVLGCGGGGDPYEQYLKIKSMLEKKPGIVKIVAPNDLRAHAMIGFTGGMGSPDVSMERMEADECSKAHTELTRVIGLRPVDGFMAVEIGGANGLVNLEVAAQFGVVCVDADWMGRAYPTYWQTTLNVYGTAGGEALLPATIASGDGSFVTMTSSRTDKLVDRTLRAVTVEMGCRAGKAGPPQTAATVQQKAILNTLSLAWSIGRAIALEQSVGNRAKQIIQAVGGSGSGRILGKGKIINVERVLRTGHTYGIVEIDGILSDDGSMAVIRVPFKNENAYVEALPRPNNNETAAARILASVPDLIAVLDDETGAGLGTPDYKYGLKVTVIAISASPRWTDSPRGFELGGPGSMGFDEVPYVPIGEYSQPKSVIDLYSDSSIARIQ